MSGKATADAVEFGNHLRAGGWRLALLVARSVEPDAGSGAAGHRSRSTASGTRVPLGDGRISAREFAKRAGTTHPRVLRYLDAWMVAAGAGDVPEVTALRPGVDVELPDAERWSDYYPAVPRVGTTEEERATIRAQALADDLSPAQVTRVASNPRAIESAILSHPKAADAARRALAQLPPGPATQHRREQREERRGAEPTDPPAVNALQYLAGAEQVEALLNQLLEQSRGGVLAGLGDDVRQEALTQFQRWRTIVDWLISDVEGGPVSADEALAKWQQS